MIVLVWLDYMVTPHPSQFHNEPLITNPSRKEKGKSGMAWRVSGRCFMSMLSSNSFFCLFVPPSIKVQKRLCMWLDQGNLTKSWSRPRLELVTYSLVSYMRVKVKEQDGWIWVHRQRSLVNGYFLQLLCIRQGSWSSVLYLLIVGQLNHPPITPA